MAELPRIRTPLSQHWRRVRYQLLPVLVFCGSAVLAGRLWHQHAFTPQLVGEAHPLQADAINRVDGTLTPLPRAQVALLDTVTAGQVVARLDDAPLLASLATVQSTLQRLHAELDATAEQVRLDREDRNEREFTSFRRLTMDVERLRLWMLERQVVITTDKEELKRQEERQKLVHKLQEEGVVNAWEAMMVDMRVAVLKTEIAESEKAVVEAQRQIEAAMERMLLTDDVLTRGATAGGESPPATQPSITAGSLPSVATQPASLKDYAERTKPDMDKLLGPARAAIAEQKARLEEIQLQLEQLEIKAPIGGMVTAIFRWPGQTVRIGDPIMTIASMDTQQVIGYVRQEVRVQPKVGMVVEVRRRSAPIVAAEARIERVGPQFMQVPPHHLRDPRLLEWGVPVSIAVPAGLKLVPGELVDIALRPAS